MGRKPCSFSAPQELVDLIDKRASELGMGRSQYIVHAVRNDLLGGQQSFNIRAGNIANESGEQYVVGQQNISSSVKNVSKGGKKAVKKTAVRKNPKKKGGK